MIAALSTSCAVTGRFSAPTTNAAATANTTTTYRVLTLTLTDDLATDASSGFERGYFFFSRDDWMLPLAMVPVNVTRTTPCESRTVMAIRSRPLPGSPASVICAVNV